MNFQKPFTYQFQDAQWPTKLGLASLISLVPILNFAAAGYSVDIIRNVSADATEPLPNWDDLGGKFRDGLILAAASLVYAAPLLIALCFPLGLLIASGAISRNSSFQDLGHSLGGVSFVLLLSFLGHIPAVRPATLGLQVAEASPEAAQP